MRDEGDGVIDSLEETFRIGRELGVPVVVSHHKVVGTPNHGRSAETLPLIERAMRSQKIGLDCYPYCASSTILSCEPRGVASKTLVTWSKPHPEFAGRDLDDIARRWGLRIEEAVAKLLPAGAIYFSMDESRRAAHPRLRAHHDRLRRPAARCRAASAPVGHVPARARATTRAGSVFFRSRPRSTR